MQTFDLKRSQPLPPLLLPYMRLAHATTQELLEQVRKDKGGICFFFGSILLRGPRVRQGVE